MAYIWCQQSNASSSNTYGYHYLFLETLIEDKEYSLNIKEINNDTDIIDVGFDSMSTLLFINALESKLKQKLDLDKLEIFDFKVSINNLYQAFFNE